MNDTPRRTRDIRRTIGFGALLAVLVGGVVVSVALTGDDKPSRSAVERYEKALLPLVTEWGRIEVQGMRPAIGDLRTEGEGVPAEAIAGEADIWGTSLESLRDRVRKLDTPAELGRASALFDQSIVKYIEAADAFEAAASLPPGSARDAGIERGITLVTDGARIYNDASLALQAVRKKAGLEPSPDFPDYPAGRENAPSP